jgi:hypothetical protein
MITLSEIKEGLTYFEALNYSKNLVAAWSIPSDWQLKLMHRAKMLGHADFQDMEKGFWSFNTPSNVRVVDFEDGGVYCHVPHEEYDSRRHNVRCIRKGPNCWSELIDWIEKRESEMTEKKVCGLDDILIREDRRTVNFILRQEQQGRYILSVPDCTWSVKQRSYFIESILMRIPIPAFYLSETIEGTRNILYGVQRFWALKWFFNGERLVSNRPELNDARFADLPARLQTRLEDALVLLYTIDYSVPAAMHSDIIKGVQAR